MLAAQHLDRVVTVSGTPEQVQLAQQLVAAKLTGQPSTGTVGVPAAVPAVRPRCAAPLQHVHSLLTALPCAQAVPAHVPFAPAAMPGFYGMAAAGMGASVPGMPAGMYGATPAGPTIVRPTTHVRECSLWRERACDKVVCCTSRRRSLPYPTISWVG